VMVDVLEQLPDDLDRSIDQGLLTAVRHWTVDCGSAVARGPSRAFG
jgi:hypothetical protein